MTLVATARKVMAQAVQTVMASSVVELPVMDQLAISSLMHKLNPVLSKPSAVITLIAARRGEGTSSIAQALASTIRTALGRDVLLLRADNPGTDAKNKTVAAGGFAAVLAAGSDIRTACVQDEAGVWHARWQKDGSPLSVVPDAALLDRARAAFPLIILDAPALESAAEGLAFARLADSTVLVIEAETTRREVAENLRDTLQGAGATLAGVVLNKRNFYIPTKLYKNL